MSAISATSRRVQKPSGILSRVNLAQRTSIVEEALRLEAAGADWKAKHVRAVMGCAISTIYDTPWMMRASRRVGRRGRCWNPRELRAAQAIASGRR